MRFIQILPGPLLKRWKAKISSGKPRKKAKKDAQFLPISNTQLVFQRTLVRLPYGRIVTEDDDDVLDADDVSRFFEVVKEFEKSGRQVVKVKFLVNEHLYSRFNNSKAQFLKDGYPTDEVLVFHGTRVKNIENIVQHGFRIGGIDGHPVTHGSMYGTGIYTDKNGSSSGAYGQDLCVVACKALTGQIGKHTICPPAQPHWLIFTNVDQLLPCYVVYFNNGDSDTQYEPLLPPSQQFAHHLLATEEQDSDVDVVVHSESTSTNLQPPTRTLTEQATETTVPESIRPPQADALAVKMFSASLSTATSLSGPTIKAIQKQLMRVLRTQMNVHVAERGWSLDISRMDRLDVWEVCMSEFDAKLPLSKDMKERGLKEIVMEFTFPSDYPAAPPFARVISPRLLRFMEGGGGHVEAGGAICVELLTSSGWDPQYNMEGIFQIVHALLSTTNPPARLAKNWNVAYTMAEAKEAFIRVAAAHNWKV